MKRFKFQDNDYECDDEYTHVAADKNGEVFAYLEKPNMYDDSDYWDHHLKSELEPLKLLPISNPNWKESLVEI